MDFGIQVPLTRNLKIQYLESGIHNVKSIRSSIFTADYVFIFRNETCWSRFVRNSNKVKGKRLMFQKQYPVDLVIKYI